MSTSGVFVVGDYDTCCGDGGGGTGVTSITAGTGIQVSGTPSVPVVSTQLSSDGTITLGASNPQTIAVANPLGSTRVLVPLTRTAKLGGFEYTGSFTIPTDGTYLVYCDTLACITEIGASVYWTTTSGTFTNLNITQGFGNNWITKYHGDVNTYMSTWATSGTAYPIIAQDWTGIDIFRTILNPVKLTWFVGNVTETQVPTLPNAYVTYTKLSGNITEPEPPVEIVVPEEVPPV